MQSVEVLARAKKSSRARAQRARANTTILFSHCGKVLHGVVSVSAGRGRKRSSTVMVVSGSDLVRRFPEAVAK